MAISRETVLHVARLARLELEAPEIEQIRADLGKILEYVDQLAAVAVDAIEPTTSIAVSSTPLRRDEVVASLGGSIALEQAPRHNDEGFLVPGFVDEA